MKHFEFEIQACENGYLVLEGIASGNDIHCAQLLRKRWVAIGEKELGELIEKLALDYKEPIKP